MGASTSREPANVPKEFREETSTSAAVDVVELDVLYRNLPSYQPEPVGESKVAEEIRVALPSMEPITFPAESVGEMTVIFLTPPALVTTGLRVITNLTYPTLVVEPALS